MSYIRHGPQYDLFECGNPRCQMYGDEVLIRYVPSSWEEPGYYDGDLECESCGDDLTLVEYDTYRDDRDWDYRD